jgi:hypothetical protein
MHSQEIHRKAAAGIMTKPPTNLLEKSFPGDTYGSHIGAYIMEVKNVS